MTTTTEEMRREVGDDPVKLPENALACASCGVAVEGGEVVAVADLNHPWPNSRTPPPAPIPFSRCEACTAIHEQARAFVAEHPGLRARLGSIVEEQIETVLHAFKVINMSPPEDLTFALSRMHPVGRVVTFCLASNQGLCSRWAYASVSLRQRDQIKRAFRELLADRVALSQPPVPIRCPSGGCQMCGLVSIERSAIEVKRSGGPRALAQLIWRETTYQGHVGHVCRDCAAAIDREIAFGESAINRALITYTRTHLGKAAGDRLEGWLEDGMIGGIMPWVLSGTRPSTTAWWHLAKMLNRLDTGQPRRAAAKA